MAFYQCLQLYAQTIGSDVVQTVLTFVEANLRSVAVHAAPRRADLHLVLDLLRVEIPHDWMKDEG